MDVASKIRQIEGHRDAGWAWLNYLDTVRSLTWAVDSPAVIEIGGGRSPSFTRDEIADLGITYTSNDISERELSLAPEWVRKAHFDVQTADDGAIEPYREQYDIAFSKMVMEHVPNYRRAYRNIHAILRDGGISIAFHPVLFSFPFVLNRLMPEAASAWVLKKAFPDRTDAGTPKFPAVYSGCRISEGVRRSLREIGFRNVWQIPFYGHNYYARFPGLRTSHKWVTRTLAERNVTPLATFAFTVVQK